ncbi:MAG: LysM peptidoglycan-binding domain-containing protein [Elusimicrobia bacterium]|nr:LysM peptidoglycan-binding domain-containing protein [Elusimicrobiota bacterium]
MNAGYRFNVPTYTERFVGDAAAKAGALKTQIDDLRAQRAGLETSIAAYRVNKGVLESDLTLIQSRMRDMEERLKNLELELIEAQYKKDQPPPKKPVVRPKPEKWPKLHKVAPGDTLRSIASKYYGNPNLWERIYEANQKHISKGLPMEGAVLKIPAPPPEGRK